MVNHEIARKKQKSKQEWNFDRDSERCIEQAIYG